MFKYLSFTHISAGFVTVLVGYTSAGAIVFQAASASGASPEQIASWMWAVGLGMGGCGLLLSLFYKTPVMIAWSTPGAALLVTSLPGLPLSDAIGAFIFCSGLITLCALTGWVDQILKWIPNSLAAAMLAGVLLQFGLAIFPAFLDQQILVGAMTLIYVISKIFKSPYGIVLAFTGGVLIASFSGLMNDVDVVLTLTQPVIMMPTFTPSVLIGVGLPLFIVTMASQNLPGLAVLRAHKYTIAASPLIGWTGVTGLILAPFGGFAFNLAAITAAICMGDDVDKDPKRRYLAAIWAGAFNIAAGLFGGSVAGLFSSFPHALVVAIASLALLGTIANSLASALHDVNEREAAILCLVICASGVSFLGIGSAFWGLFVGISIHSAQKLRQRKI